MDIKSEYFRFQTIYFANFKIRGIYRNRDNCTTRTIKMDPKDNESVNTNRVELIKY